MRSAALGLVAALAIGAPATAAPLQVEVEPVTLIDGDRIAACGVSAVARGDGPGSITASLLAIRDGDRTVFELSAVVSDPAWPPRALTFRSASHTSDQMFPPVTAEAGGGLSTRAALDGLAGAMFIQEVLISGGTFQLGFSDGPEVSLALPSPMPHGVRQSYLQCAGDLFRPDAN